jgi:4-amino-4-deoxy-L-arabinose transferase-like glycosyltransferase
MSTASTDRNATPNEEPGTGLGLALFCGVMSIGPILAKPLTYSDEVRVAGIAREMLMTGEWAFSRLNGVPFLDYPTLGYLPLVALFGVGGAPNDLLALLPGALAALGCITFTWRMGRRIAGPRAGYVAAFALQTTFGFLALVDRVIVDPQLLFWICFSLDGFLGAVDEREPRRMAPAVQFHAGMAGAFLTKGLIGIGVPAAVAGMFLLLSRRPGTIVRLATHPSVAALVGPIAFWSFGLYLAGGSELVAETWRQSFWRFLGSDAHHSGSPFFYLERLSYLLLPWFLLLPVLLWDAVAPERRRLLQRTGPLDHFPLVWFGVVLCALSVASAKRNVYIAPIYPAFALWCATAWARAREQDPDVAAWRWVRDRVPRSPRSRAIAFAAIAVGYLGYHTAFELPEARRQTARPPFDRIQELRAAGAPGALQLVAMREGMQGATVYYLGETAPHTFDLPWTPTPRMVREGFMLLGSPDRVDRILATLPPPGAESVEVFDLAGDPEKLAVVAGRPTD